MGAVRGKTYCDTIASFFAPRIAARFGLEGSNAIAAFNLLTPANNASLTIKEKDSSKITITWEATSGQAVYATGMKLPGNNPPIFEQVGLTTNSFSVKASDLYTILKTAGVVEGTATNIEWQASAIRPTVGIGRMANAAFIVKVTLEKATGLIEADLKNMLIVYPNPASNDIKVTLNGNSSPMSEIVIMDIMGREVRRATNLNTFSQQVNLNGLNAGIYFANIKTAAGGAATQRFIIQ
jgi:hypothetical protein